MIESSQRRQTELRQNDDLALIDPVALGRLDGRIVGADAVHLRARDRQHRSRRIVTVYDLKLRARDSIEQAGQKRAPPRRTPRGHSHFLLHDVSERLEWRRFPSEANIRLLAEAANPVELEHIKPRSRAAKKGIVGMLLTTAEKTVPSRGATV